MTDQELRDLVASIAISQAKTDAQMAKTDARLNKLAALYGGISDNQGSVAEEFFFNSLSASPVVCGIKFDRVMSKLLVGKAGRQTEFDLILVNGNSVALIEVKHKAHASAIEQLEKQIKRYRESIPEHANYKLYGGIAGLSVPEDTAREAHKRGMFVLKQVGSVIAADPGAMHPL
jgi:hypothetical protein